MTRFFTVIAVAATLAACQPTAVTVPPPTVAGVPAVATGPSASNPTIVRSVVAAEQALTLAMRTATVYATLPRCGPSSPRICSDREVVRQIRRYAIEAHEAIVAARANEALVDRAWRAINLFRSVVPGV